MILLLAVDLSQVSDHYLHQLGQVDVVLPVPLLPGQLVVEDHGPAVRYLLPGVWTVGDPQVRNPFLDLTTKMLLVSAIPSQGSLTSSNISSGVKLMA